MIGQPLLSQGRCIEEKVGKSYAKTNLANMQIYGYPNAVSCDLMLTRKTLSQGEVQYMVDGGGSFRTDSGRAVVED
jgi:hypothetical protein